MTVEFEISRFVPYLLGTVVTLVYLTVGSLFGRSVTRRLLPSGQKPDYHKHNYESWLQARADAKKTGVAAMIFWPLAIFLVPILAAEPLPPPVVNTNQGGSVN